MNKSAIADIAKIAAAAADDVDRSARFPVEAVDALRAERLLSCCLPAELGGRSAPVGELAAVARTLGAACSSAAMVFAMHHTQALTLAHHGTDGPIADITSAIARDESLLASATTEITTGGDVGRSTCAVERPGGGDGLVVLEKTAPVISYGAVADYICATARRSPDAEPADQVLVVCPAADTTLEQIGTWDVLGFRGTCSPGFQLRTQTSADHVLPVDYATISAATMLPASHTLWASVWLGIADAALSRAREATRAAVRRAPGQTVPQAAKLADLTIAHQRFEASVTRAVQRYEEFLRTPEREPTVTFTVTMNNLKLTASTAVVDVVLGALELIGINAYREDHPASMSRLIRDSLGPQLMVSNDRIRANNAHLVLAQRDS